MENTINILNFFYERQDTLPLINVDELRDVISLSMVVLNEANAIDEKRKAFVILGKSAQVEKLPIQERWAVYCNLVYKAFVDMDLAEYADILDEVYISIYNTVDSYIPNKVKKNDVDNPKKEIIVIVTSQFLGEQHAPTRRVLDYAYTMQRNLGKQVVIINDCGMRFQNYGYMNSKLSFNDINELNNRNKIEYKGTSFLFYQTSHVMPDVQEIANLVWNIKELSPELVLSVGASCITSDLCKHFTKTATIPCSTKIPTSAADNLILCRDLRKADESKLQKLLPGQRVIESVFNYKMPEESAMAHYQRKDFGVPENAWLISVAGNRLNTEMDLEFLKCMNNVLSEIENAHFMVVGDVDVQNILKHFSNSGKVHLAGRVSDGSQAIRLSDIYVQPRRQGGGRAAFEALYYGIPTIIPNYGDAWDVCGSLFEVNSYDEMKQKIYSYYNDSTQYRAISERALEKARKLEDMQSMFMNLFDQLGIEYEKNLYVDMVKFKPIFKSEFEKKQDVIERKLDSVRNISCTAERRLRDNEWAVVFNSTINGSNWFKNVSLSPGRCAIAWPGLYALYRSLDEFQPKSILEMGLGQSTRVISSYAMHFQTKHYIVEHDKSWINFFLDKHGVSDNTEIINLERVEDIYNGRYIHTKTPIKHYKDFKNTFSGKKFDFVFIDGPQGSDEFSRVDFTEILPEALMESFVIMVDDSQRNGETHTINCIYNILKQNGIDCKIVSYDGLKDTALIVSPDLTFLCSL